MTTPADSPPVSRRRFDWFAPVVTPLLADRRVAVAFAITGIVQTALGMAHLPGVPCPVLHGLGIPCPGCGASRACAAFAVGDWHGWIRYHLFAPLFLLGVGLLLAAGALPQKPRERLLAWTGAVERKTGVAKILVILLVVYWLARLVYAPVAFARLMKS